MKTLTVLIFTTALIFWGTAAHADMTQIKAYKEALGDDAFTQAKTDAGGSCLICHVDKMPKKDDGAHENNDYGKFVLAAAKKAGLDKPTADTYKAAGTSEAFAKNAAATK